MKKYLVVVLIFPLQIVAQFTQTEISRWQKQAADVSIIRDNWGIPHVYGKTDADAVFGLLYAQCEDDFKRVETNYIEKLGRLSEIEGKEDLYNDLLIRLLIDSTKAIADYNKAEPWLKKLLEAYADGINFYLYKNPQVKPALLNRFKPWYPLLWTDGSIGAISTADITTTELENFYSGSNKSLSVVKKEADHQAGSNGFAIAPSKTESGNAILYINPHTTFYFRPEVQVVSEQGLNVYGAVTWGQFFVYQGFNENCGWMHTSANVDVADTYEEKIIKKNGNYFYEYNKTLRPVREKRIPIKYLEGDALKTKIIKAYYTHHGPVMAKRNGKWISLRSNNRSMSSLVQSWQRTKAKGFEDYKKAMDLKANTSNSTVFADSKGNIALWHGNFIPVRDKKLNWSKPVDGTSTATEWKGLHKVEETVHIYNPANGWIQNCNSTPFTGAGTNSPKKENYPSYMAPDGENFRGINAVRVLDKEQKFTIDKIIAAGYDRTLSAFEILTPALINAFEKSTKPGDSLYEQLKEPIAILKTWDYRTAAESVATTLAIEWAQKLEPSIQQVYIDEGEADQVQKTKQFAATATAQQLLQPLNLVLNELNAKFGKWQMPWGELNRFQRLSDDIQLKFDDSQPSLPVPFASALWGMLPSFNSRYFPGTDKRYGVSGNSFVCAVEFGKRIKAKSLLAGGESGHQASKHFTDQAEMYTKGIFKDVLFYKEDVIKAAQRSYHPGE
jgi:acyl-homoserine lactone acylase PvdQ